MYHQVKSQENIICNHTKEFQSGVNQENEKPGSIFLSTPREFNFYECLAFLDRSRQERLHSVENRKVRKLIQTDDELVLIELSNPRTDHIRIEYLNGVPPTSTQLVVQNYIGEWFDLDKDLTPFYEMASRDNLLRKLVRRHYGLRILKIHDLFQALCWAILGQQINLAFAYTLYRRFIESYGENFVYRDQTYWLFPTPAKIAGLSVNDLMRHQLTGRKSEYIIEIAKCIEQGDLSKERLLALNDFERAGQALLKIRGIGPWTANYVMMRCLGDPCAFPIEDIGLHNAIKQQLNVKEKPSIEEIRKMSAGWTNWQAYATFYLYRSLL